MGKREIHDSTGLQRLTRNYSILFVCSKIELKHMDFAETGLKKGLWVAVSRQGIECTCEVCHSHEVSQSRKRY